MYKYVFYSLLYKEVFFIYYYVYEWFIVETGEIFYVGKGSRNRYKFTDRNNLFKEVLNNNNCDSRIIKYFETEEEAYKYEAKRIQELKEIGQCICNIMPGGAGGSGEYWTDELRKYYSENNVMKRPEQRIRMSKNNPMKNPEITIKVNSQKRVPIIFDGIRYSSIKEIVDKTGHSEETIQNWCLSGHSSDGKECYYEDNTHVSKSKKMIPFTYLGVHYESYIDFYKNTGIPKSTVKNWLRNGYDSHGNICKRDNDVRNLEYRSSNNITPIIVNGVKYNSISEATRILNVRRGYFSDILKGVIKDEKYICTYDDQQPS